MSFLSPPKVPSAASMTAAQQQANASNVGLMQKTAGNTAGPYQSISNIFDPNDPNRLLTTTSLSPENQSALDQLMGNRSGIGAGIGSLIGDYSDELGTAPDLSTAAGSLTSQMLDRHLNYMEPYFNRERNALENKLNVQGATDNARQFAETRAGDNRARNVMQAINTFEPMAFSQAKENYQTPINTIRNLMELVGPFFGSQQGPSSYTSNAADAQGNMQTAYQNQQNQYNNMMKGIMQLGSAAMGMPLGTAAGSVPTIGSSIGGGLGSMFGLT